MPVMCENQARNIFVNTVLKILFLSNDSNGEDVGKTTKLRYHSNIFDDINSLPFSETE